ncbi:hypothetical protein SAMN06265350_101237 [Solitalea koreensis]|uniref:Uncharacterized protein n=1 Tax=Solitalea koreensis TaxID=543615 RepID=A0A521ALG5_9SPHI|nr:hypothetical protein SAMN06265350_101237 [Solitalea koreensis]
MRSKNSYLHCTDKAVIHKTVILTKKSQHNPHITDKLDTLSASQLNKRLYISLQLPIEEKPVETP